MPALHGVQVPWVNTAAEVEQAVQSAKYGPRGLRGLAGSRQGGWGLTEPLGDYTQRSNRETMVVIHIETAAAAAAVEEYIAIDDVDVLFIGPTDLSAFTWTPRQSRSSRRGQGHGPGDRGGRGIRQDARDLRRDRQGGRRLARQRCPLHRNRSRRNHQARNAGLLAGRPVKESPMETIRLTTAQAIVKWLLAQRTVVNGEEVGVFAGAFGIFGHGNVTCLAEALQPVQDELPTWRGHNEQSMALGRRCLRQGYARPPDHDRDFFDRSGQHQHGHRGGCRSRQPGSECSCSRATRFQHRIVDPVLQQVENFGNPTITVADTFKPVTRYWDRISRPEQIIQSLPQALAVMLDPPPRAGLLCTAAGHPGRGLRLPGAVLRAEGALHPPSRPGPARDCRGCRRCSARPRSR